MNLLYLGKYVIILFVLKFGSILLYYSLLKKYQDVQDCVWPVGEWMRILCCLIYSLINLNNSFIY